MKCPLDIYLGIMHYEIVDCIHVSSLPPALFRRSIIAIMRLLARSRRVYDWNLKPKVGASSNRYSRRIDPLLPSGDIDRKLDEMCPIDPWSHKGLPAGRGTALRRVDNDE